ncbi:MAG: choice-of-anchor L domain-containing protein [Bifidobacteriaceae bacterium]|jgi:hypothetical protein|nr:choice-of-anchor L domain-containing protein [Bifidobacteriaceae bacterium]
MKKSVRRISLVVALTVPAILTANAAFAIHDPVSAALDVPDADVVAVTTPENPNSYLVTDAAFGIFPTVGSDYLILSTGLAADVLEGEPSDYADTDLGTDGSATGDDLTQLSIELAPPAAATCLAFDFQFLSEEYPDYIDSVYNDVFTAELNTSSFEWDQPSWNVIAPNNFAFDDEGNPISINYNADADDFVELTVGQINGAIQPLTASTPVVKDPATGHVNLILSIQDVSDSYYDSAVLIDGFRWSSDAACSAGVIPWTPLQPTPSASASGVAPSGSGAAATGGTTAGASTPGAGSLGGSAPGASSSSAAGSSGLAITGGTVGWPMTIFAAILIGTGTAFVWRRHTATNR